MTERSAVRGLEAGRTTTGNEIKGLSVKRVEVSRDRVLSHQKPEQRPGRTWGFGSV